MKNTFKRIIAVFAVLCVASTSFISCGDKVSETNSPAQEIEESSVGEPVDKSPTMKYPFEIGEAKTGNSLTSGDPNNLDAPDPEAASTAAKDDKKNDKKEPATEVVEVTEADGQPATEIVEVTEADGQPATDKAGEKVTEAVKVTQVVTKPTEAVKDDKPAASDYTPLEDGRYAMWLDISEDENFYFEDAMIKATFKVKEGIPDGDYEIRISPDLSDIAGVVVRPSKVISGKIRVNNGEIEAVDVSGETGLIFYGDAISCKQGDTIDFNINIKNNPGLAAFCIWFYFDSNALEFIDAGATGDYEKIARQTDFGEGSGRN